MGSAVLNAISNLFRVLVIWPIYLKQTNEKCAYLCLHFVAAFVRTVSGPSAGACKNQNI
jgi:hypothetical protein